MKSSSFYLSVYAATLLVSAALLFSVQPMFAKMILPLLGGSANVWNMSMLFFQIMLLGGYCFAHVTSHYLKPGTQALLQIILLLLCAVTLPLHIPSGWVPPAGGDPTGWQLALMFVSVGGPFFAISALAPMIQRWFSFTNHKDAQNPYFLYGASNLGSLSALLAYPLLVEPFLTVRTQAIFWAGGYVVLIALIAGLSILTWKLWDIPQLKKKTKKENISWGMRGLWLMLAFIPSSLMLGVTTFITTDVASMPLLWIIPLTLYLATFIIVFARKPRITREMAITLQGVAVIAFLVLSVSTAQAQSYGLFFPIVIHLLLFFFCALSCHSELARVRPQASKLTEFYLFMSLGGALGGFFNAIVAPNIFLTPFEYTLAIIGAVLLTHVSEPAQNFANIRNTIIKFRSNANLRNPYFVAFLIIVILTLTLTFAPKSILQTFLIAPLALSLVFILKKRWLFAVTTCFIMLFFAGDHDSQTQGSRVIYQDRSFYGIIKILERNNMHVFMHGTTIHGLQKLTDNPLTPVSYYHYKAPVADGLAYLDFIKNGAETVGVIGLGAGSINCHKKQGRHFEFFEIDQAVINVAENPKLFNFLSGCGNYNIVPGDARLTIKSKPDYHYNMLLIDAFSSDNIPVHLLTLEALEMYRTKLKPNGVMMFHISNGYLNLAPVLTAASKKMGVTAMRRINSVNKKDMEFMFSSDCVVFLTTPAQIEFFKAKGWKEIVASDSFEPWTDDYSGIIRTLSFNRSLN